MGCLHCKNHFPTSGFVHLREVLLSASKHWDKLRHSCLRINSGVGRGGRHISAILMSLKAPPWLFLKSSLPFCSTFIYVWINLPNSWRPSSRCAPSVICLVSYRIHELKTARGSTHYIHDTMHTLDVPILQTHRWSAGGVFLHHRTRDRATLTVRTPESCAAFPETYF